MKTETNRIDGQAAAELIKKSGLRVVERKSRTKVMGPDGRHVLVPAGKTVATVYLVGFEAPQGVPAGKLATGTITQVLDMSGTEEQILGRFEKLLHTLSKLEPVPQVEKPARAASPRKGKGRKDQVGARAVAHKQLQPGSRAHA